MKPAILLLGLALGAASDAPVSDKRAMLITSANIQNIYRGYLETEGVIPGQSSIPLRLGYSGGAKLDVADENGPGGEGFLRFAIPHSPADALRINAKKNGNATDYRINRNQFFETLKTMKFNLPIASTGEFSDLIISLAAGPQEQIKESPRLSRFFLTDEILPNKENLSGIPAKTSLMVITGTDSALEETKSRITPGLKTTGQSGQELFEKHFFAAPLVIRIEKEILAETEQQIEQPVRMGWYLEKPLHAGHPGGWLTLPSLSFEPGTREPILVSKLELRPDNVIHFEMEPEPFLRAIVAPAIGIDARAKETFPLECFIPGTQRAQDATDCKRISATETRIQGDLPAPVIPKEGETKSADVDAVKKVEFHVTNKKFADVKYIVTITRKASLVNFDTGEASVRTRFPAVKNPPK
jgi:hypothetical protein